MNVYNVYVRWVNKEKKILGFCFILMGWLFRTNQLLFILFIHVAAYFFLSFFLSICFDWNQFLWFTLDLVFCFRTSFWKDSSKENFHYSIKLGFNMLDWYSIEVFDSSTESSKLGIGINFISHWEYWHLRNER